jgi:hypothetical protein
VDGSEDRNTEKMKSDEALKNLSANPAVNSTLSKSRRQGLNSFQWFHSFSVFQWSKG